MALINLPAQVTTDAVECTCGSDDCFFCEPFAGMTDDEMMDELYACPKCDVLGSQEHEEWCPIGQIVARWNAGES